MLDDFEYYYTQSQGKRRKIKRLYQKNRRGAPLLLEGVGDAARCCEGGLG